VTTDKRELGEFCVEQLRKIRDANDWSLTELARAIADAYGDEEVGVSEASLSRWFNEKEKLLEIRTIRYLLTGLDIINSDSVPIDRTTLNRTYGRLHNAITIRKGTGELIYANANAAKLMGCSIEEFYRLDPIDYMNEEDALDMMAKRREVINQRKTIRHTQSVTDIKGRLFECVVTLQRVTYQDTPAILSELHDTTQPQIHYERLKIWQTWVQTCTSDLEMAFWTTDKDLHLVRYSAPENQAAGILGLPMEDIYGLGAAEETEIGAALAAHRLALQGEPTTYYITVNVEKGTKRNRYWVRVAPLYRDHEISGVAGVAILSNRVDEQEPGYVTQIH
jgi:PAS domain S-box-containing protein